VGKCAKHEKPVLYPQSSDSLLYTIEEARSAFPIGDKRRVSSRTLWRWMTAGRRGVCLRWSMVGGRRMISAQAISDFLAATNRAAGATEDTATVTFASRAAAAREALRLRYGF
jgi:hypothetical protein